MTTDPFTAAAHAEAERRWSRDLLGDEPLPGPSRMNRRIGFDLGAQWARQHLASQEPTEAEVDAAALEEGTLTVLREAGLPLEQYDSVREHLKSTRDTRPEAWAEGRNIARRILTAARRARGGQS